MPKTPVLIDLVLRGFRVMGSRADWPCWGRVGVSAENPFKVSDGLFGR